MGVVVVTDHVFPHLDAETELLAAAGHELRFGGNIRTPEEVVAAAAEADGILNCYAPIPAEVIRSLSRCRVIAPVRHRARHDRHLGGDRQGDRRHERAGLLHRRGVRSRPRVDPVPRSPGGRPGSKRAGGGMGSGPARPVHRLRGRTLGLVGFGRIARRLAEKTAAIGFRDDRLRPIRAGRVDGERRGRGRRPGPCARPERRRPDAPAHARDPAPHRASGAPTHEARGLPREHLARPAGRSGSPSRRSSRPGVWEAWPSTSWKPSRRTPTIRSCATPASW